MIERLKTWKWWVGFFTMTYFKPFCHFVYFHAIIFADERFMWTSKNLTKILTKRLLRIYERNSDLITICSHVLQLAMSWKHLAFIWPASFTPRIPVPASLPREEAPFCGQVIKLDCGAVSSSRGERLIACKTFMSCGILAKLLHAFGSAYIFLLSLG